MDDGTIGVVVPPARAPCSPGPGLEARARTLSPCDSPTCNVLTLAAMRLIADAWIDAGYTVPVSLDRVVAAAWMPRRLEQCRSLLAEGRCAPPITVVRYRCGQAWLYEPCDGNHRSVAAREAGRRRIQASIAGESLYRPVAAPYN